MTHPRSLPNAPSPADAAGDPLHAQWQRLGAALAAFDRAVRGETLPATQDASSLRLSSTGSESPAGSRAAPPDPSAIPAIGDAGRGRAP